MGNTKNYDKSIATRRFPHSIQAQDLFFCEREMQLKKIEE